MKVCSLLQAIKDFRSGNAEPGTIGWDDLMHHFEGDAEQYADEQLYELGYSEEEVVSLYNTPKYVRLEVEFMEKYLGREEGLYIE